MNVAKSEASEEHEMKVDGSDDEGLTTVDLATRTVTVGTTRVDWMDEMMKDTEARDEERAAQQHDSPEVHEKRNSDDALPDWDDKYENPSKLGKARNDLQLGKAQNGP
eukprot:jgi/Phyca11/22077/fgenesh1_pg.PHYCAscaffold_616_\